MPSVASLFRGKGASPVSTDVLINALPDPLLVVDQSDRIRLLTRDGRQIPEKSHYFMDSEVPGCPSDWIFATVPTGDSVTQCSIHVVTGEGQKPFAVGFDQVDRAGLVAWRAEGL